MKNYALSVLIPARNEMFLRHTIEDLLAHREADTEVIAVCDGAYPVEPIPQMEGLNLIYVNPAVGQRAATNLAAKLSRAKYVMKLDAHCAVDQGYDRKLIEGFQKVGDDVVMSMVMWNLHAFDWKCRTCGKRTYQGPPLTKCEETNYKGTGKPCAGTKFTRRMVWEPRKGTHNTSYAFNPQPHFIYFPAYRTRPEYLEAQKTGFTESMSLQGSCFVASRDLYWKLELSDEKLGNWGGQGVEVACKAWLSGHRVMVNHATWYAHLFRTRKDFGFPWPVSGRDQEKTKAKVKELFWESKWPHMIHPVSWLVEKFWPIPGWANLPGWTEDDLENLKQQERKAA